MNTTTAIIVTAIVAGAIIMLVSMVVMDHISYIKEERRRREEKEMEKYYNSLLPKRILLTDDSGARGYISSEYAFGRWYLRYYYRDSDGVSYFITKSFNNECEEIERYGRRFSKYDFDNAMHCQAYSQMEERIKLVIKSVN
jgi:hypothetical protein